MKRKSTGYEIAKIAGVSAARGLEAVIKAQLITGILEAMKKSHLTHVQLAIKSGLPRSAVTGILSGSLQKVTIDRVLRLVEAAGLTAEIRVRPSAA